MADPYDPRVRWLKIKNLDYWSLKVDGALSGSIAIAVQTDAVFFTYELRHWGLSARTRGSQRVPPLLQSRVPESIGNSGASRHQEGADLRCVTAFTCARKDCNAKSPGW